jgi:hypothetical protein
MSGVACYTYIKSIEPEHRMNYKDTMELARMTSYMDGLAKANDIQLHPNNFDGDTGIPLSHSRCLATNMIKQMRVIKNYCKE